MVYNENTLVLAPQSYQETEVFYRRERVPRVIPRATERTEKTRPSKVRVEPLGHTIDAAPLVLKKSLWPKRSDHGKSRIFLFLKTS